MPKSEFMSLLTLQTVEGKAKECLELLKGAFDDPTVLGMELFSSQEDPEILLALHRWPSFGAFQGHMKKLQDHQLFDGNKEYVDYIRVTSWNPID